MTSSNSKQSIIFVVYSVVDTLIAIGRKTMHLESLLRNRGN
jgi:hypothetical protein